VRFDTVGFKKCKWLEERRWSAAAGFVAAAAVESWSKAGETEGWGRARLLACLVFLQQQAQANQ